MQTNQAEFSVAHKNNNNGQILFEEIRSVDLNKAIRVPVALSNYDLTGIVIVSANGHELPPSANQLDKHSLFIQWAPQCAHFFMCAKK